MSKERFFVRYDDFSINRPENRLIKSTLGFLLKATSNSCNRDWHIKALEALSSADIVFLDPDNGLLVKSVSTGSAKSNKYVISNEIADYFTAGKSVIIYNHRCREQEAVYLQRFAWMHEKSILKDAVIAGVTYKRGTVRDYIFTLQPSHAARIMGCLNNMLQSPWENHFAKLALSR